MPSNRIITRRELLRDAGATLSTSLAGCVGSDLDLLETDIGPACSDADPPFPDDWPLHGYDARNINANPNAAGPKDEAEVRWIDGGARTLWGTPVVADDAVYVAARETVHGFDADIGDELWRREVYGGVSGSLSVADDTVYAATTFGQLYALAEPTPEE